MKSLYHTSIMVAGGAEDIQRFTKRYAVGTNVVVIDPDLAKYSPAH